MSSDNPLKIAAFLDNRAGHIKQTLGVLDALAKLTDIQVRRIELPHLSLKEEIGRWVKYLLGSTKNNFPDLSGYDLIIGTGSRTHIPMLTCKRIYHIPVVTCMTPTPLLLEKFDLCLVPQHDQIKDAANILTTVGPPNRSVAKNEHDENQGLILIGGRDEKSHHWRDREIIDAVAALIRGEQIAHWTISTSPRTPAATTDGLAALTAESPNVNFVKFEDTGPGWIEREYDRCATAWVTADSMSMVFEALSAGCRVGLLPVTWKKPNNKFARCAEQLLAKGYISSQQAWLEGRATWTQNEPLNEARRCAKEILKRWWPNRLQ